MSKRTWSDGGPHPSRWRISPEDPTLVLDDAGQQVVRTHTAETAQRIVDGVNGAEHPSIVDLSEKVRKAVAAGYTEGDVNHLVQPVSGQMALQARRGREYGGTAVTIDIKTLESWIERLNKATAAETAWLYDESPQYQS